jgi:hypothetical protein
MRDLASQAAWIAGREAVPFAWGTNDCVTFAAGAVAALTGADPLGGISAWSDERSAVRALAQRGGLAEAVSGMLERVPVAMAMRGDVGMVEGALGPARVIIEGLTLVGPGPDGIERWRRECLIDAWSAGE